MESIQVMTHSKGSINFSNCYYKSILQYLDEEYYFVLFCFVFNLLGQMKELRQRTVTIMPTVTWLIRGMARIRKKGL